MRLAPLLLALVSLTACEHTPSASARGTASSSTTSARDTAARDSTRIAKEAGTAVSAGPAELMALQREPRAIRALYVNRFAAQGKAKMRHLIGIADSTEVNGLVVDIKDEFGLNFHATDPVLQRNEGTMTKVADMRALVDTIRAHGILPIARIVVFKDSVAARANPSEVIRKSDGTPWRDKKGITWVNPYSRTIWDYNLRVAEEAVRMGFGEVQFDYIRFPEPYKSLPPQVFPGTNGRAKPDVLAEFLHEAEARMNKMGVRVTADIFGLVTTVGGPLEVGQFWEKVSPNVNVVLPMVYPSHYPHGSFGLPIPNAEPYRTVFIAVRRAHERDDKLGINTPDHVRPWLQAFTLGAPHYGPSEISAQKRAAYDAGYDGWVLWNPGSKYDEILPALDRTFVSHKRTPPLPLPAGVRLDQ